MKTIDKEVNDAREKYGPFHSTHEVYGVLMEEVEEAWQIIKRPTLDCHGEEYPFNAIEKKKEFLIHELTQIAAIAQRAISELENNEIKWV